MIRDRRLPVALLDVNEWSGRVVARAWKPRPLDRLGEAARTAAAAELSLAMRHALSALVRAGAMRRDLKGYLPTVRKKQANPVPPKPMEALIPLGLAYFDLYDPGLLKPSACGKTFERASLQEVHAIMREQGA